MEMLYFTSAQQLALLQRNKQYETQDRHGGNYFAGFSMISKRLETNQNMAVRKGNRGSPGTLQGQVKLGRQSHSIAGP